MPEQTPFTNQPTLRLRAPNKIATTNQVNEVADVVNKNRVLPKFGQVVEAASAIATASSKGQYQGMQYLMRTNNSPGWDFAAFVPPLGS